MRKLLGYLGLIFIVFPTLCFASETFKVKGLYLGMPQQEACTELKRISGAPQCEMSVRGNQIIMDVADPERPNRIFLISVGFDRSTLKANRIVIPLDYFGAEETIFKEFAEQFVKQYNIPSMRGTLNSEGQIDYIYKDPKGYAIVITREPWLTLVPAVIINKIASTNELDFN